MVAIGNEGRIVSQGPATIVPFESQIADSAQQPEVEEVGATATNREEEAPKLPSQGRLIVAEEIVEGNVRWHTRESPVDPYKARQ